MKCLTLILVIATCASAQTVQTLTTAGPSTWTAPAGVTSIKVECIGGGGGGATMTSSGGGGGGGGGAYARRNAMAVTPGVIYSYTVGSAGATNGGGNGGTTTFTGDGGVQCVAVGGASVANNSVTGGAGGLASGSTGDAKFDGGAGASGGGTNSSTWFSGGGAGSGGSASNGNSATNSTGATAVTGGGPGGSGKAAGSGQGSGNAPANGPGGGGGGGLRTSSGTRSGGAGWAGQIKITYNTMTTSVTETKLLASSAEGQYTNNGAKTASVTENIQYVSSDQSRWGQSPILVGSVRDVGGRGFSTAVSEVTRHTANWFGIVPAENWAVDVTENIQHVPSNQTRIGLPVTQLSLVSSSAGTAVQGALHLTATVVENIPYRPGFHMEWGAEPSSESLKRTEATSQQYSPGVPAGPPVPRRPVVIR